MPANAAACFHTSALHPAQYSWPGKHDKGLCLLPGSRFPGVLLPLFQAEQHLCTFFKTSLTIFPCCGIVIKSTTWARSSAGRAFGSHPRGRGFDPLRVHQIRTVILIQSVSGLRFLLFWQKRRVCGTFAPSGLKRKPGQVCFPGRVFAFEGLYGPRVAFVIVERV